MLGLIVNQSSLLIHDQAVRGNVEDAKALAINIAEVINSTMTPLTTKAQTRSMPPWKRKKRLEEFAQYVFTIGR